MKRAEGTVKKIYIPKEDNKDIMSSNKIGFVIEINKKLYKYETKQNDEICNIMRNDKVEVLIQIIDGKKFIDINKLEGEL